MALRTYQRPAHRVGELAFSGCVIRLYEDPNGPGVKPQIHENSTHINYGVKGCSIDSSGQLVVAMLEKLPVVTCGVWMDETIGGTFGVTGGISGGGEFSTIRLSRGGKRLRLDQADGRAIAGPVSNLWLSWTQVAS